MVAIICMKWGQAFTAHHVNTLFASVLRNMEEPFTFVCLTDDDGDLANGILALPIPDLGLPEQAWKRGCWPKLAVFAPHLFPHEDVVLFLDLDIMVLRPLAPFIAVVRARQHLVLQREWNPALWSLLPQWLRPDRGGQSSVFGFCPYNVARIYEQVVANAGTMSSNFKNDQTYLSETVADQSYWPSGFCVSFKRSCVRLFPFNLLLTKVRLPGQAKIVVFHGTPRPWETVVEPAKRWGTKWRFGRGPVAWIVSYFAQADVMLKALETSGSQVMTRRRWSAGSRASSRSNAIIYLPGPEANPSPCDPAA
ncbi:MULTISPECIES: hypothetical protein [Agrobacterium]|uniref:hypothetical protein n=1 Tax=Agrobacterium TaxID=357 RepID=UPI001C21EE87|nr:MULTISPECIES: hypothetical protein [Agrobacterium]MDA5639343.1 hypothetical protein [Agrobacterium sp. ST15.13.013]MDA6999182.1 hypothetical protein [Agrobacterium salinitolerans]QXC52668.1 hypothetical protein KHC17_26145 [Agrobacterium salinitolerans]